MTAPTKRSRFASLRVRVTLAMLALAAVGSSIFAASVFVAAERLEQTVLDRHVRAEFDTLANRARRDPSVTTVRSALLLGFVGRENPELPAAFAALSDGRHHAVKVGDKAYQVYVGSDHGRELYAAYDITEWEALETPVINNLIGAVVLVSVLAVVLGFWISRQVITPVTALSERLRALDPRQRNVRIAPDFAGEVAAIAESFDRYMERLDGFVEREQLFTAAAAHELRTPLAVIQGATEVLAEQRDLPPPVQRVTARLERATHEMREFIEALLFLSREEPANGGEQARCELRGIVTQLVEDYRGIAGGAKNLKIELVAAGELWLDTPPALPTIVISNLLRNAVEHTDGGTVRVALEGRTLRITDTGRGIPEAAREALFARGYSTKPGGGMGLHLTKRICDRFGWQLTIASTAGKGTTASVAF
jgi:signal transduction histidine kinase